MIKINPHNLYVVVFANEMSNFITNFELGLISLQGTYNLDLLYADFILIPKSHTMHLID